METEKKALLLSNVRIIGNMYPDTVSERQITEVKINEFNMDRNSPHSGKKSFAWKSADGSGSDWSRNGRDFDCLLFTEAWCSRGGT
ncbi:MAG: hypothetical protein K0R23_3951 [Lacrimispora sp.]|jgi:hypothetical protein|nr:hypothetical protein [Lacrimispora sp.]